MLYRSTPPRPLSVELGVWQCDQYGLVAKQIHGCALVGVYNGCAFETTGMKKSGSATLSRLDLVPSVVFFASRQDEELEPRRDILAQVTRVRYAHRPSTEEER